MGLSSREERFKGTTPVAEKTGGDLENIVADKRREGGGGAHE